MKIITHSVEETQAWAKDFSHTLKPLPHQALILALVGELGAGKTSFTQGLLASLGVIDYVTSPTFVIEKVYSLPKESDFKRVIHIDAYRLSGGSDLDNLGFSKLVADPENLIIIEWPERIKDILPPEAKFIYFSHLTDDDREIRYDE